MQSDPLVKVSSTSERFAKMRAQKEAQGTTATATASVAEDPLAHFQAEHHAQQQKAGVSTGGQSAAAPSGTPVKKAPPVPRRHEVTAAAVAKSFLEACEKPVGPRADERAYESIEGVMEVAQRGAWAHVLSGASKHRTTKRSKVRPLAQRHE